MLRASPGAAAAPSATPRPDVAIAAVFEPPANDTLVVRGRLRTGSAAALILESTAVCVVSADRTSRCRFRRFTIPEVLSVEHHRIGRTSELVIVTATASIAVGEADTAAVWSFCRELRQMILAR